MENSLGRRRRGMTGGSVILLALGCAALVVSFDPHGRHASACAEPTRIGPPIISQTPSKAVAKLDDADRSIPVKRSGRVKLDGHGLGDDGSPFLGFGVSYFTALWRFRNDRKRLESDLEFLSTQGFNYYRMLSMVGWFAAWDGLEIAPVSFTSRSGKRVDAWPDYWQQLAGLVDLAYDRYGMRTQITIFADAQLMPTKPARIEHMGKLLKDVVAGREHKIILLEVANEAWQNGFPGDRGVAELRELAGYLGKRTEVLIAITSNHEGSFQKTYARSAADIATWHFSRDKRPDDGWMPVYDCWKYGDMPGMPPASSNEPIGPGSSVAAELEPIRLVSAAAFAYIAKLPMYVFHCEAGVFGKQRFEETPAINAYGPLLRLLPGDMANWQRNDGKEAAAPFTSFAAGKPDRYWPEVKSSPDGCVRNIGSRKGDQFICLPIGIRAGGLKLAARHAMRFSVYDPLTGKGILTATKKHGEEIDLPAGPGALLIVGTVVSKDAKGTDRP